MNAFLAPLSFIVIAALCMAPAMAQPASARGDEEEENQPPRYEEKVTVTATRLPLRDEDASRVPAGVTVIDRESIERSGLRTLQELMRLETGTILYDQTGNFVQTTFDLRGFTTGSGTRVYLDGVPYNNPNNNSLALHMVPLGMLEQVEITRGSAATLAGGGSEAGVIHLRTRRVEDFGGELSLAAGSDSALRAGGSIHQRNGQWDFLLHGTTGEDDGFRENAGGTLSRLGGSVGYDLGRQRRLELTVVGADAEFGTPGALTQEELDQDREAAPANRLDFLDERYTQAAINFRGGIGGPFHLAANLYYVDRADQALSTGRSAPVFGGFFTDSEGKTAGTTVQMSHQWSGRSASSDFTAGVEWLESDTDASGFSTPPDDPGAVDPGSPTSRTTTDRRTQAIFVQETWSPVQAWGLTLGLRWDSDRLVYDESVPDPTNQDSKSYSELSARAGVTWTPAAGYVIRAAYGEAFLPPTVQQLFAFPGFGSNPDLVPQDTGTWELGLRRDWGDGATLDVALLRVDTENEIIFDPDSDAGPFGANVNAGQTRRMGIEAGLRGKLTSRLDGFINTTFIDAEFANGPNKGSSVPLVPGERISTGLGIDLGAGFDLRADATYVSDQVLDNDDANAQQRLPAYTVVNSRLSWDLGRREQRGSRALSGLLFFAQVTNLLDEEYATRGIYAFDFSAGQDSIFLTPAPGRRFMLGLRWRF